jgi:hypothetical protein
LLVWLLFHSGLDELHDQFDTIGFLAPLVLLPYIAVAIVDAISWRHTLPPDARRRVPFLVLVLARMAGEAVNSVTPTATIGGEPLKAELLRTHGITRSDGLASIVVAKTTLTIAQSLFTALGFAGLLLVLGPTMVLIALWPRRLDRRQPIRLAYTGLGLIGAASVFGLYLQAPYGSGSTLFDVSGADVSDTLNARYSAAIRASTASESSAFFSRPPLISSPRPSSRYSPKFRSCATSCRRVALTRCALTLDKRPSGKEAKRRTRHSLTAKPRMASPRNSSCSLSEDACPSSDFS